MIKKNNKILVGALALLLAMTVGYALFSDTLTINGTATAQGNFDLTYACELLTSDNASGEEEFFMTKGGTGTCTFDETTNTITTTSSLTKPTDQVGFKVTITNTGSIPAILKTVDSDNNVDGMGRPGDIIYHDETYMFQAAYGIMQGENGYSGDSEIENAKITIEPNGAITVLIMHTWADSSSVEQPKLPAEGASFEYNVTLGFEQITS